jgi:hypothetical protein
LKKYVADFYGLVFWVLDNGLCTGVTEAKWKPSWESSGKTKSKNFKEKKRWG